MSSHISLQTLRGSSNYKTLPTSNTSAQTLRRQASATGSGAPSRTPSQRSLSEAPGAEADAGALVRRHVPGVVLAARSSGELAFRLPRDHSAKYVPITVCNAVLRLQLLYAL